MSFSFNDIKYGWKIIAGVVITGATIFVADNTRQQILQRDTIQPILGTHERCLSAGVAPLEFVRTWTSNVYDTSGVTVYTNIVTNAIGWRVDRGMLVDLDAKIEELAPYFVDINSVYYSTTNIVMHTFTNILTTEGIGDGTNFTAYGWYVSQDDLKERCKVLYVLKYSSVFTATAYSNDFESIGWGSTFSTWGAAKTYADANLTKSYSLASGGSCRTLGAMYYVEYIPDYMEDIFWNAMKTVWKKSTISFSNSTPLKGTVDWYVSLQPTGKEFTKPRHRTDDLNPVYSANGTPNSNPYDFYLWGTVPVETNIEYTISEDVSSDATWCTVPSDSTGHGSYIFHTYVSSEGFLFHSQSLLFSPEFYYCTNKFW